MKRVVFAAPPFSGHLNPVAVLALAAQRAGYDVEVLTGPTKLETLRAAGLRARAPEGLAAGQAEAIADSARQVTLHPGRLASQVRRSLALSAVLRNALIEHWRRDPPALVVADFIAPPAGLAAEALGVPWITVMPTPFGVEARTGAPSYLGGLSPRDDALGRLRDRLGWAGVRLMKDALHFAFRRRAAAAGLPRRRVRGREMLYSPTRILALGLPELEFPRDWPETARFIGPVFDHPEAPPPPLALPSGRNVLVSFGTHLPWAKAGLEAAVAGLAERVPEASFTLSLGEPARKDEPPRQVGPRVRVAPFVSYRRDLPRFDAVAHHGGAGVTWACAAAAVPQIVIPQDYDQFDFAARVAWHGLGERVRRVDSEAAAEALRRILARKPAGVDALAEAVRRSDAPGAFLQEVAAAIGAP